MSSLADLTSNLYGDQSVALVHALLTNTSRSNFIRPISSSSHTTNWSISHIPGPPHSILTSSLFSSPSASLSSSSSSTTAAAIAAADDDYYPFWLLVVIAIFGSVTSVLTVLGNILVILAFFLDRQIRQPTNYFILSLSVSDFLIGLLSMPLLTIYIYARDWPLNGIICDIWLSLDYTVCLTSIYTVLFITIDRFCSVKMPAKYRKWRTCRKINIMIAVTWAGKRKNISNSYFKISINLILVPTIIFFSTTLLYPHIKGVSNLQNGVCMSSNFPTILLINFFFYKCDVQWNKNHVFNLCLTIGYFWTTLFVMIVLYIFIYGMKSKDLFYQKSIYSI
jgi:muscarinic acetylcholine receptor M3